MPNPFNFTISDTSPIFHYFPTQDGPIDSSWNASFSGSSDSSWVPESLGIGTSAHRTTLPGASVRLDWLGTGIYLYGHASAGAYTIEIDGATTNVETNTSGLLFAKTDLTYGPHWITLHVVQGTSTTSISSAIITVGMGVETGTTIQNRTIATTTTTTATLAADGVDLIGTWSEASPYSGVNVPRINTAVKGSAISFPISAASAFYIIGHVNFNHGPYLVTFNPPSDLGAAQTFEYNGSSRWVGLNTLKFLATGLDRTRTYHLQVTNQANLFYDQSKIVIFDTPPAPSFKPNSLPSPSPISDSNSRQYLSAGSIAGITTGLSLFLIILILLFLRWRKRRSLEMDDSNVIIHYDSLYPGAVVTSPSNLIGSQRLHPDAMIPPSKRNLALSGPTPSTPDLFPPYPIPSGLTEEDARFFNNLYARNVPAADIASMMEALRAERDPAATANRIEPASGHISSEALHVEPDTVPPRYEFTN